MGNFLLLIKYSSKNRLFFRSQTSHKCIIPVSGDGRERRAGQFPSSITGTPVTLLENRADSSLRPASWFLFMTVRDASRCYLGCSLFGRILASAHVLAVEKVGHCPTAVCDRASVGWHGRLDIHTDIWAGAGGWSPEHSLHPYALALVTPQSDAGFLHPRPLGLALPASFLCACLI